MRPKLEAYRARLLAHPAVAACVDEAGRTGPFSRSARPTATKRRRRLPQELIGLDHFAEPPSWLRSPPFLSGW